MDGDAAIGRLDIPFGFASSPALFALGTDAIQRAHRSYRAKDGSFPRRGDVHSELFVGGAIFAEADMGNISIETAA